MRQAPQSVDAILEIGRQANGDISAALVSAAYRASRATPIMLVLDSVTPADVDRVLDPVVAGSGYDLCGVIYVNKGDEDAILSGAATASRVFARSAELRATLSSRGIAFRSVEEAEAELDDVRATRASRLSA